MEVERLDAILTNGDVDITGYSNGADESGNKGSGKNPWG